MKTYVSIGLQLHLSDVKLKDGKLKSGYIINGAWKLDRFGNKWRANKNTSTFPIKDEDFVLIEIPKKYEQNYNEALSYANYLYESTQKPQGVEDHES